MLDLSIVIVNWNSKEFLRQCLKSVSELTDGLAYEVIVIDSGSFDGAGDLIAAEFQHVLFIQSQENVGFARANNEAYRRARGSKILFLNPDTELINSAIGTMYEFLDSHADAGAVGCKLLNGDGTVQTSCVQSFPTLLNQALSAEALRAWLPNSTLWGMAALYQGGHDPSPVDVISGACLMVRREAFEKVGFFSEEYFMYAEDLDLCYKLRRAGYVNYFVPRGVVKHFGGGSTASAPSEFSLLMMRESIWRFLSKSRGSLYAAAYRATTAVAAIGRLSLLSILWSIDRLRGRKHSHTQSMKKWLVILQWGIKAKTAAVPA